MPRKKAEKKRKLEITFDPQKRIDFLTGFRKRKNERRKRAKEELQRTLKEEHKKIRQDLKEGLQHLKRTFEPLRVLTDADKAVANEDEYEDEDVKVKIVELTVGDMAAQRHMLGENRTASDSDEVDTDAEANIGGTAAASTNCIPGMDFDAHVHVSAQKRKRECAEIATAGASDTKNEKPVIPKSKKELNRMKSKTLKQLKNSKAFKMKERFERTANQKKAQRDKNNTLKSLSKTMRRQKKLEPSRYHKGRLVNRKQLRKSKKRSS